jgi:hypothetical protein
MDALSKMDAFQDRFKVPLNVGFAGGDLPARYFAAAAVVLLTVLAAPPLQFAFSTLKIFALLASMSGTILLMAGLVFSQKTHFAGVMLIPTSFMMMGLAGWELAWPAVLIGLLVLGWISQNIVTKRCGINKLLGVNSCSK